MNEKSLQWKNKLNFRNKWCFQSHGHWATWRNQEMSLDIYYACTYHLKEMICEINQIKRGTKEPWVFKSFILKLQKLIVKCFFLKINRYVIELEYKLFWFRCNLDAIRRLDRKSYSIFKDYFSEKIDWSDTCEFLFAMTKRCIIKIENRNVRMRICVHIYEFRKW